MAENQQSNSKVLGVAFVCVFGSSLVWWSMSPSELDVGRATLVTLRSRATNKFVEVSAADGLLRVSANVSGPATRFRMLTVAPSTVARLRQLSLTFERTQVKAGRNGHSMVTRSGCKCSGFSNEHGFGRFCHAWETKWQDKWCYVEDSCTSRSVKKGSFGRRHDVCTPAPGPSPPPNPPPSPPSPPPPPQPILAPPFDALKAKGKWVPPPGCACTGFANKHGYGKYCYPWERSLDPAQIPWCYVGDGCSAAVRRGSFGREHADCVLVHEPPSPPPRKKGLSALLFRGRRLAVAAGRAPPPPTRATLGSFSRVAAKPVAKRPITKISKYNYTGLFGQVVYAKRYNASHSYTPPGRKRLSYKKVQKSHAHEREEVVLLKKIDRIRRKYVAFVSETTQGFVTVAPPPHDDALQAVALTDKLSLQSIFAILPGGHIASLGTNALLTLCDPKAISAADLAPDPSIRSPANLYSFDQMSPPPPKKLGSATVCTGTHTNPSEPYRLLRIPSPTNRKSAEWSVVRV